MRNLPDPILKVNKFLPDGPTEIEDRVLSLEGKIARLASTLLDQSRAYLELVLQARLDGSRLAFEAAQAAMLHAGARAYVDDSVYSRHLRESYFIAIVTPATKHLEKDIADIRGAGQPEASDLRNQRP
jgi:alkylation response protein AidB-like acyl-CoA dehydrogenase